MKKIILIAGILFLFVPVMFSQNSDSQLASQYFKDKEYDKASELYKKLFEKNKSQVYFSYYLRCLTELKDFETAEKEIKRQLRGRNKNITYYVEWGYLFKLQNKKEKSVEKYKKAIENMRSQRYEVIKLANAFLNKREYDFAEKTYIEGRKKIKEYNFRFEIANVYAMSRNYNKMIDEYLSILDEDKSQYETIQQRLQYYVTNDEEGIKDHLRKELLRRIQSSSNIVYNEFLIWLYIQEKNFRGAFIQAKALDKRNNENGNRLIDLGQLAVSNKLYDVAIEVYQYVIDKGKDSKHYVKARYGLLNVIYEKVVSSAIINEEEIEKLEQSYLTTIEEFGKAKSIPQIRQLAHLQAFYLDKSTEAIQLLQSALKLSRIAPDQLAECKIEYADILLLTGDVWEATLTYAQVEKQNANNPIGHKAKYKKALLAYYVGNFEWAQAQLDILKASTSKLIANDALDLSLLISDNTIMDSTETALRMFASAELLSLQHKDSLAMMTLDSILTEFTNHSLHDEVYFKKAMIEKNRKDYHKAIEYLDIIAQKYNYDILADDAVFLIADIYENIFNDKDKAMELYKKILMNYQGSIYVVEARKRFRTLRGDTN